MKPSWTSIFAPAARWSSHPNVQFVAEAADLTTGPHLTLVAERALPLSGWPSAAGGSALSITVALEPGAGQVLRLAQTSRSASTGFTKISLTGCPRWGPMIW